MRISDWSSDVCFSDLPYKAAADTLTTATHARNAADEDLADAQAAFTALVGNPGSTADQILAAAATVSAASVAADDAAEAVERSEEHTSELQSLMRISYAVFCLKKKKQRTQYTNTE